MFVGISPLLDILHCYFVHGAPWHDVLFFFSSVQKKETQISLLGFYERSNPAEKKLCPATLLCHPRRSDSRPVNATNAILFSVKLSNFLSNMQPQVNTPFLCLVRPNQTPSLSQLAHSHFSNWAASLRSVDQPSTNHRLEDHTATGSICT